MYSHTALKIYAALREDIIKTNAQFWREFSDSSKIEALAIEAENYAQELWDANICLSCCFDEDFPALPKSLKSSERPFLFAYKGDFSLLRNPEINVAVVGVLTPNEELLIRERNVIERLVAKCYRVVSGLAIGCDTVAHGTCLEQSGKTIAFLPSTLTNIYPKQNSSLAKKIMANGGLVITEYVTEPKNRYENVKRLIERDRLQAMFADRIVLIASYRQGNGDSGSRHAMAKAKEYGKERFVMFRVEIDGGNPMFALNEDLIADGANVITNNVLNSFS